MRRYPNLDDPIAKGSGLRLAEKASTLWKQERGVLCIVVKKKIKKHYLCKACLHVFDILCMYLPVFGFTLLNISAIAILCLTLPHIGFMLLDYL